MVDEDVSVELNDGPARVVLRKAKAQGLIISRVPQRIRDNFTKFAEDEFADDRGMALKYLWDIYELWSIFMQNWEFKLNYIVEKLENQKSNIQMTTKRMLSGKNININLKGEKDEK